jgi:hypothetical protein
MKQEQSFAVNALLKSLWISVNDELPTPGERVIATNGTFSGEAYYAKDGCWYRHFGLKCDAAFYGANITQWIPMPQLRDE